MIFCDGSKFYIFVSDGQNKVCRNEDEEFKHKYTRPSVKHGGEIVLVWEWVSSIVRGYLPIIDNIMDKNMYLYILKYKFLKNMLQK